ncbi:hypothetical protein SFRURICE_014396, partial [Spodoptera frugiperda]
EVTSIDPSPIIPALLTRTSSCPKWFIVSFNSSSTSFSLTMSATTDTGLSLLGDTSSHFCAVFSRFSLFLPVKTSFASSLENSTAVSAPMPELAPVISTTLLANIVKFYRGHIAWRPPSTGFTALTRTLFGASSRATHLVNWSKADLDMQYARTFGKDRKPVTLDTLTIFPFVFTRWYGPRTLVFITRSYWSSEVFSMEPDSRTPALFTKTSSCSNSLIVVLIMFSTSLSLFISAITMSGFKELGEFSSHCLATFSKFCLFLPVSTNLASSFEKSKAVSAPIPELAPVISTTLFANMMWVT